jgi:hypothetical protein
MEAEDRAARAGHTPEPQQSENGNLHGDISGAPDCKLLQFGISTKFRCLHSDCEQLGSLQLQLEEARAEWNRRHPILPLVDSF